MDTGTVKFFNESKGFGFIKVNGTAQDVFVNVHFSDLQEHIQQNDEVSFDIQEGKRGLNAVNVKLGTSFSEKKSLKSNDELTAFY
ncbi:MAG: cold shock domain-containing protein, partial [Runella slithyformis]